MNLSQFEGMTGVTGYLNRLMSRTMDGVIIFDDLGRLIFANPTFGRLIGQEPSRLLRHSFLGIVREDERAGVLARWRALASGCEETYRVHLNTATGERLLVVVQYRLELAASLHLAYIRDLTESAELSRQMHELSGLAGIAGAFATITDPRQVTQHLVTELAHLLGVEKCYIGLHDPVSDMVEPLSPAFGIPESLLPRLRTQLAESGHFAQIFHSRQPRMTNDARRDPLLNAESVRELEISSLLSVPLISSRQVLGFVTVMNRYGSGFHDDDVRPLQIFAGQVAVVIDNARLVSALAGEKELAVARAGQLEALVNSIADGVFIVDAASRHICQTNTAIQRLFGLEARESERPAAELVAVLRLRQLDGRPLAVEEFPWQRALAGETVHHQEILFRPAGAVRDAIISVSGAPVRAADGEVQLAVLVARDVTDLRELQRQKDEFLSVASHELRTPLTTLRGYTQQVLRIIERGGDIDRERVINSLHRVIRQVDRMAAITGDLVDVSRLETGQLSLAVAPCELTPLVTEVLDRFRARPAAQGHRLTLIAPSRPIVGEWDAARLEQIFMNLIDNAIKYSPDGGSVEVRLRVSDRDALVTVRDEGIGISADKVPQLFHAFYRVESVEERTIPGLGLGLHIVRELVALHGGTVTVESEPGRGSTFTVTLPLVATSTRAAADNALAPEAHLANGPSTPDGVSA